MTTNAFEAEKTRLHQEIAVLSNGAVKLCGDQQLVVMEAAEQEEQSTALMVSVDSQQFLLEKQATIFAVEKYLLEQQLQEARQSLENVQQAQLPITEECQLMVSVDSQEFLLEEQATVFAAEKHQLQEQLHQALQCLEQAEGDALEERTRCGEQQLEIASLSDLVSQLKAKNSELSLTVQMSEAVAEMTTNAFEGEKTRLHKQIAMLSNGAVKLCADLATATASLQKASEMRKRYAALMASEQLLLEKYAELQDVNASLVLQLQEAEANGSERVMSLQSNGSCEPHLLQHLVNTPEPQEQTTALIVPTSVTEQLALLFAPSTNSCFAADGTPWSLMPTSQTNSADSERMLREATEF
eukprot:TRINITY_DN1498_c0_g1_i6.p1 TRINITY_DN1498_c0_g1~~TRINITY_DN1498_c0_g1_i6.p1  ORF type:complete len:356 (-),score=111.02 TRINITY_DN1498_c0_g1_i6:125-1192(-)